MEMLNILDVTVLEPRLKHSTIFARFDELPEGATLTIHNDHDPKPLYYQMLGERGNVFIWEYLEEGPVSWKVAITRRITGENEETLGEIAAKDLRKVEVFKKYGIDFCCGGKKTIREVCLEKGLDQVQIEKELIQSGQQISTMRPPTYSDWKIDFLSDYIVNTHHSYVQKMIPELLHYAKKVAGVHGQAHPELISINSLVQEVCTELVNHMAKEEKVLFPFIKNLVNHGINPGSAPFFGSVQSPVAMMEEEHEFVGVRMEKIRSLSKDYALPSDACASYTLLFNMLKEFEEDLHLHIHLENNILFPKALALEKVLQNGID
ncbi:MAG TPA: iron-sulfur cluster repair di-iron protein [Bacteroidetes bacterium]|nr:iron-sulfur cluster repair di-iron protein [Bacteroidota bacterium]